MKIRLRRQDRSLHIEDEAVNALGQPEDAAQGCRATPSGRQQIMAELRTAFGDDSQDLQAFHLDRYESAEEHAAPNINHAGLTRLLLGKAGLFPRRVDDLMLKVDGDRGHCTEIYTLLMNSSKGQRGIGEGGDQAGMYFKISKTTWKPLSTVRLNSSQIIKER
eukprot:5532043-Pyramimonas_sp.AAC.1